MWIVGVIILWLSRAVFTGFSKEVLWITLENSDLYTDTILICVKKQQVAKVHPQTPPQAIPSAILQAFHSLTHTYIVRRALICPISSRSDWSSFISVFIFSHEWMTVVWSLPPNF
jgi:hypothetical protein